MISRIKGKIIEKDLESVVVMLKGIGFKLFLTESLLSRVNKGEVKEFFTYLVVRENVLDLYGFSTKQGLEVFKLLISVSGIGPKGALNVLGQTSPSQLLSSVSSGDFSALTRVSGIGEKTAQRVVLELKNKVKRISLLGGGKHQDDGNSEAIEALIALGYTEKEANKAVLKIDPKIKTVEEKVRVVLKTMGK